MATTRIKRPFATRTNDVDGLASNLGTALKISDAPINGARTRKTTRLPPAKPSDTPKDSKSAAMKSINNVLQSLASSSAAGKKLGSSSARASATAGRAALNILRKLEPRLLDTERAALSMVGKLLALNLYDAAMGILEDVRRQITSFYPHTEESASAPAPISLLQLPVPTSSIDPALQTCAHIYLSHSFAVAVNIVSNNAKLYDSFYDVLQNGAWLKSWAPHLSAVSRKSLDGLFKRVYASLTNSFVSPIMSPVQVLKIRFQALQILLLSKEVDVTPFWEQCLKCAASYARNPEAKEGENEKVSILLGCFEFIEREAHSRREGKGWIAFCEYWLALARRVS